MRHKLNRTSYSLSSYLFHLLILRQFFRAKDDSFLLSTTYLWYGLFWIMILRISVSDQWRQLILIKARWKLLSVIFCQCSKWMWWWEWYSDNSITLGQSAIFENGSIMSLSVLFLILQSRLVFCLFRKSSILWTVKYEYIIIVLIILFHF